MADARTPAPTGTDALRERIAQIVYGREGCIVQPPDHPSHKQYWDKADRILAALRGSPTERASMNQAPVSDHKCEGDSSTERAPEVEREPVAWRVTHIDRDPNWSLLVPHGSHEHQHYAGMSQFVLEPLFPTPTREPETREEEDDETARCTCNWMCGEWGRVDAKWPAEMDLYCAVHGRKEAEREVWPDGAPDPGAPHLHTEATDD